MAAPSTTLVWFRRDLRVADHEPLAQAAADGPVTCLFVIDPGILARRHHAAPARLRFLRAGLEALAAELRERGGDLVVRHGDPSRIVPDVAREVGAGRVAVSRDLSPLARRRDSRVREALRSDGVDFDEHDGDLVVPPERLGGPAGQGYKVFTPFYRAWRREPVAARIDAPESLEFVHAESDGLGQLPAGDPPLEAGPAAARARLVAFIRSGAADAYGGGRDLLAEDGTSRLSAYLRLGMCTGAQIGRALGVPDDLGGGREAFWRQVAWREFFHHLLWWHPGAARTAFRERYRAMRWDDDPEHLAAWTEGRTGFPIVDAAMRQLATTGWMHNRARLIAGSFLVKDLLVDWRLGETVFMQRLVDGDPASNNGGWQWIAGTGTDAAPYFRVLNPVRQGKRFDPDGDYVRRYVPELGSVPAKRIHEPWTMTDAEQEAAGVRIGVDYPAPIVDHGERREAALARYGELADD